MRTIVLFLLAGFTAITWSKSGVTQGPCAIERGQDPFEDGLGTCSTQRDNLWILLDVTDSMDASFPVGGSGETRLDAALRTLQYVVSSAKDSSGRTSFNWSFHVFCGCNTTTPVLRVPLGQDNAQAVLDELANGENQCTGTRIGKTLNELASSVAATSLLNGQKNYVLLVTDGIEGCAGSESNLANESGRQLQYSATDPLATRTVGGDKDERLTVRGGDAARQAIFKMDPAGDASKGDVFTIGLDLDSEQKELTNHIAWSASNNRRAGYFADDPDELVNALLEVMGQLKAPSTGTTTTSLTSPVVATVKELMPYEVQTPRGTRGSNPNVTISDITDPTRGPILRAQNRNNVMLTTTTELPSFKTRFIARKVFNVQSGPNGQKVPAFNEIFWDAGEELQKRAPDDRTIFFNRATGPRVGDLIPFRASPNPNQGVTPNDLGVNVGFLDELDGTAGSGAKTALDAARMVEGVTRGYRLSIDPSTGTFYRTDGQLNFSDRDETNPTLGTWKLWEPTHAGPTVVINPVRSPNDPPQGSPVPGAGQYADFYNNYVNRLSMIYMGTNDGLMHAFRADSGFELFAYVPDDLIGLAPGEAAGSRRTLSDRVRQVVAKQNTVQNHFFGIASSATVEDVFLRKVNGRDDDWHTVIFFGRGQGGKFLTGVDVSQVGDWTGTIDNTTPFPETGPRIPQLLFNVGNRDGSDAFDGMGETWSTPAPGQVRLYDATYPNGIPQSVLFAGSGYGCSSTLEGSYFYVLQVEDGSILKTYGPIGSDPAATIKGNALVAPPAAFNPHLYDPNRADPVDYVTRVFVGDLQGKLYKLDTSSMDPNSWTFGLFFSLASNIQAGVDQPITAPAALLYRKIGAGPRVFVGTGGDERVVKNGADRFYMVGFNDDAADGAPPLQSVPIPFQNGGSFMLPLAAGERVYVAPVTAFYSQTGGSVFFAASTPGVDCRSGFTSNLYGILAGMGLGAFDADGAGQNGQTQISLGQGKATGLYARGQQLYVGRSAGFQIDASGNRSQVDASTRVFGDMELTLETYSVPSGIRLEVAGFSTSVF